MPLSLTDSTDPVVGTEGLIYDPKNGVFGGMGAAPITDNKMLTNPLTGQSVSQDLVLAGYQKIYGSDTTSEEGALLQNWGSPGVYAFLQANPGTQVSTLAQQTAQTQTSFELYGPWDLIQRSVHGSIELLRCQRGPDLQTAPAQPSQMFTAIGTPNTTAWNSATAL